MPVWKNNLYNLNTNKAEKISLADFQNDDRWKLSLHLFLTAHTVQKILIINDCATKLQLLLQNEQNEQIKILLWFPQSWKDDYLTWDPKEWNGIERIIIPKSQIWIPDGYIFNTYVISSEKNWIQDILFVFVSE